MERNDVFAKGIIARKDEKKRQKRVRDYERREITMPNEDAVSIVDPEVEFKASNPTWLAEEARKAKTKTKHQNPTNQEEDEEDYGGFIIDTTGDSKLRDVMIENDDFMTFDETDIKKNMQLQLGENRSYNHGIRTQPIA